MIRKYLILILCFLIAFVPIWLIFNQSRLLDNNLGKIVFFAISGGLFIIYIVVTSIMIFKKKNHE